ncbi:hypothetical protein PMIN04_013097 [Paraphaeosphaeria minitans]
MHQHDAGYILQALNDNAFLDVGAASDCVHTDRRGIDARTSNAVSTHAPWECRYKSLKSPFLVDATACHLQLYCILVKLAIQVLSPSDSIQIADTLPLPHTSSLSTEKYKQQGITILSCFFSSCKHLSLAVSNLDASRSVI